MIDWKYADLFKQTSVKKTYIIDYPGGRITNEDLYLESVEITEAISNEKTLKFGGCVSSSFKFKTKNISSNLIGQTLSVSMVVNDDYANPLQIGRYVARTESLATDGLSKTVTCYDALYDVLNTDYSDWYHYIFSKVDELTINQFRYIFFELIGIQQRQTDLILDDYVIREQSIVNEKITGNVILSSLCEINACFGKIGRSGAFEYVRLESGNELLPRNTLYPSDSLYPSKADGGIDKNTYITCKVENFIVQRINRVELLNANGVMVGGYGSVIPPDRENKYTISNIFVYSMDSAGTQNAAFAIYNEISEIFYQPFTSKAIGNPCMEVGDSIKINLADGRVVNSYVMKRSMKGIHALSDEIGSNGTEYVETKNVGLASDVRKLKETTSQQYRVIDEMVRTELKIAWVPDEAHVGSDPYTFYLIE